MKQNPLPDALKVTADSGDGRAIAATLRPLPPGVETVTYKER
jgi:cell division protein FtsX